MPAVKTRQSGRRLLRILWVLQGHTVEGLRLKQVALAMKAPTPTVYRDLETLADEGLAERIPGREEFWRLTPKLVQLARAHDAELQRERARLDEIDQRFTRIIT